MTAVFEGALQNLIDELGNLPNVGPKSAQRMAFHLLAADAEDVRRLSDAILQVKEKVRYCEICGNITEGELCQICRDPSRDPALICVVEEPKDISAIERARVFRGRYHVLGGVIDPLRGIGPDDLRVRQLIQRLSDGSVREVIIATNPSIEGEATATYLARTLQAMDVPVSRLAQGLPVGGDLDFADAITLGRALEGRRTMD